MMILERVQGPGYTRGRARSKLFSNHEYLSYLSQHEAQYDCTTLKTRTSRDACDLSAMGWHSISEDHLPRWFPNIWRCCSPQVATVLQAESDGDERVIDLEKYQLDCSNVEEADLMALIDHRRLAVVLNLTDCKR